MARIIYVLLVTVVCSQISMAGTDIQNGGGGISINGEVATFYSAELKIYPTPIKSVENDEFREVENAIGRLSLPNRIKLELIQNITPSFLRKYYSVKSENVDTELLEKIKLEYNRVTNIPLENLTIFALTDPKTQITLLLPDYFKLTRLEQMVIILHESMWVNKRIATYADMIKVDRAAQIYFTFPEDCVSINYILQEFEKIFKERIWALNSAISCEVKNYLRYSNEKKVPFLDFMDYPSLSALAPLLLYSNFMQSPDMQKNLAKAMENEDARIFTSSKSRLISELRKEVIIKTEFLPGLTADLDNARRRGEEPEEALTQLLLKGSFMIKESPTYNIIKFSSAEIGDFYISAADERTMKK